MSSPEPPGGQRPGDQPPAEKVDRLAWQDLKQDFIPVLKRIPKYLRLMTGMFRDPRLSRKNKAVLAGAFAYNLSPIDLIPGFIPGIGQLDNMVVTLGLIKRVMDGLGAEVRDEHLKRCGLTVEIIEADLALSKRTLTTLGNRGVEGSKKGAAAAKRGAARAADKARELGGKVKKAIDDAKGTLGQD